MKYADVIVPFSTKNDKAVEMLIQNLKIKMRLMERAKAHFGSGEREHYMRSCSISDVLTPTKLKENSFERLRESAKNTDDAEDVARLILPNEKV